MMNRKMLVLIPLLLATTLACTACAQDPAALAEQSAAYCNSTAPPANPPTPTPSWPRSRKPARSWSVCV